MTSVRRIPASSPDAVALVDAMLEELAAVYSRFDRYSGPTATPVDMGPPRGGFVALYDDGGRAVAGGGVKPLDDSTAEIKRMYVVPDRRGEGLARALLEALEALCREFGYAAVRLDTGPEQPHARALYASAGYSELPDYNGNPYASFWGEKIL